MKHLRTILAAIALLAFAAQAQTVGEFTFTSPGVGTNTIADPGSDTIDIPSMLGYLNLMLSHEATAADATGDVSFIFVVSPDNVTWTTTNDAAFKITLDLSASTNLATIWTNIDVSGFRYLKLGAIATDDETTAVTNVAVNYYRKRLNLN